MAGQHSKRSRRSRNAKVRRRGRMAGFGTTAGAALAFGLTPLATAPAASADGLDVILDPIINSLSSVDPTLGVDLTGWVAGLDSALAAASSADASSAATAPLDFTQAYDTYIYAPTEAAEQAWITSPTGEAFDTSLNTFYHDFGGTGILIGDGANGTDGGTMAEATGGAGGLWFGDGGTGGTDSAGDGGAGGIAYDGDGGAGGAGLDGGTGGTGGDTAYGIGGEGGAGGEGTFAASGTGEGGQGGAGGDATGSFFGIGGTGGEGGTGAEGVGGDNGDFNRRDRRDRRDRR